MREGGKGYREAFEHSYAEYLVKRKAGVRVRMNPQ